MCCLETFVGKNLLKLSNLIENKEDDRMKSNDFSDTQPVKNFELV